MILTTEDHAHAVMHGLNQRVRLCSQNYASLDDLSARFLPASQAGKGKHRIIAHHEVIRLLFFRADLLVAEYAFARFFKICRTVVGRVIGHDRITLHIGLLLARDNRVNTRDELFSFPLYSRSAHRHVQVGRDGVRTCELKYSGSIARCGGLES